MRISRVVNAIPPSGIRRFFDIVSQMEDVISLGVGEPDFVTPWRIREAAIYALERGYTQYTSNWGLLELREEVAKLLDRRYGIEYRPEGEVLITVGVSEALDLALRAILNPGDEVLIPEPCYVSYQPCTMLAGGVPVGIASDASTGFRVRPEALEAAITPRTRAILLCYPNNPTGATLHRPDLERIAAIAERYDLVVLSDEIYAELSYDHRHVSIASLPGMQNRTIVFNGFSKAFAMTGWRLAYAAGPSDLVGAMQKIHQYTMLCASIVAQKAAIEACRAGEPDMEAMVAQYNERRRFFVKGLNDIGLDCLMPEGAFYVFPSVRSTGLTGEQFAEQLLQEERVAVVPGSAFGKGGEDHVRCSYAASMDDIREAVCRMERFVNRHRSGTGLVSSTHLRGASTESVAVKA
jgi:aminotransferase